MTPRDIERAQRLKKDILAYRSHTHALPGLEEPNRLETLIAQFIDSLRRVDFAYHVRDAQHGSGRCDPASEMFDPLRAAVLLNRNGQHDEAWWLVFLATHFGKHSADGWRLTRDIYGRLGQGGLWDWATISKDPSAFEKWMAANERALCGDDGVSRRFSNHRKYESLKTSSKNGTARIISSYVAWINPPRNHADLVRKIHKEVGQDPEAVFAALYKAMNAVRRFGRLGKFDFLAMLGKLGIAPIIPGSTFLKGATGPIAGARLLFEGTSKAKLSALDLETLLGDFGKKTGLGPQVIEDALCNWQKSPSKYVRFKG